MLHNSGKKFQLYGNGLRKRASREIAHAKNAKDAKGKYNLTSKSHAEAQRAQRIFIIERL